MPPSAEYFIGTVDDELVAHVAVCPMFTAKAYRATRLVVMPEWQGAGVGTKFLEWVCEYHALGKGRCGKKLPTLFHTSHPQLISYLKRSAMWVMKSQQLYGGNKAKSRRSISRSQSRQGKQVMGVGYGGHYRAVQGFKYKGNR